MTFAADIARFVGKSEDNAKLVIKRVAFDIFKKVIVKTPVDTGRAKGNWMVGINKVPSGTLGKGDSGVLSKVMIGIELFKLGDSIILANNLPYIGVLEYGGYPKNPKYGSAGRKSNKKKGIMAMRQIKSVNGYSYQAPQGMVRVTIAEFDSIVNKIGREIAGGA